MPSGELPTLEGMRLVSDTRLVGLPLIYAVTERPDVDSLVVLMPAARNAAQDPRQPRFPRWSWHPRWPNSMVVAIPDPVMVRYQVDAAWFVHPYHDVIAAVGELCTELAERASIPNHRIVFYGSSLGGFSAIASASQISGARAVAEVPQIDVVDWFPRPLAELETKVLHMKIDEFRRLYPERLNLKARLAHAGRVPEIRLITNPEDRSYADQMAFFDWLRAGGHSSDGPTDLILASDASGHEVLSQERALSFVTP